MPFADYMPTVVFPDTRMGHDEWQRWDKSEDTIPYFCNLYSEDQHTSKHACSRRDPSGSRPRNLCFRCPAGFLYDFKLAVETQADEGRMKIAAP
jgi:hypothetical protein